MLKNEEFNVALENIETEFSTQISQIYLIVTADDLLYSPLRDQGILEVLQSQKGFVTDTSALMNGGTVTTYSSTPTELLKRGGKIPGLHLNFTEGYPCANPKEIRSLLNNQGQFLGKFEFRKALADCKIAMNEILIEAEAQLDQYQKVFGPNKPIHIDGHQHVHILPTLRPLFIEFLTRHNVLWTRVPREMCIEQADWLTAAQRKFYQEVSNQAEDAAIEFRVAGLRFADLFIGLTVTGQHVNVERFDAQLLKQLRALPVSRLALGQPPLVLEFMTHPGWCCFQSELGCGAGADAFSCDAARLQEKDFLAQGGKFSSYLQHRGIHRLVSFSEL